LNEAQKEVIHQHLHLAGRFFDGVCSHVFKRFHGCDRLVNKKFSMGCSSAQEETNSCPPEISPFLINFCIEYKHPFLTTDKNYGQTHVFRDFPY
jgi:hypothetical protein